MTLWRGGDTPPVSSGEGGDEDERICAYLDIANIIPKTVYTLLCNTENFGVHIILKCVFLFIIDAYVDINIQEITIFLVRSLIEIRYSIHNSFSYCFLFRYSTRHFRFFRTWF